jgi:type I restriction enzyme S subunit
MTVPAYPAYRESGVEWLGAVPNAWDVKPLKHLADFINGEAFKPTEWSDDGTPIIRIQNLNGGDDFNCYNGDVNPRHHVQKGDLLFGWSGNRGTSFGPFVWPREGLHYLNQHIFKVEPRGCDARWFYWCLRAVTLYVEEQAHGIIGMVHVTRGALGAISVPLPTHREQSAIAAFLDRETGKIDALVAAQERLIALLKEKRQAVISQAVTKGLDASAPMKDSGVAWLGQVPEHWEVKRFKNVAEISYGLGQPPAYSEDGTRFLRATNVKRGSLSDEGLVFVAEADLPASRIPRLASGDIVVVRSGAYTGDSALVTLDWDGAIAGFDMVVKVDREKADPEFAAAALLSKYMLDGQINLLRQRAAQPHLNAEELGDLVFLQPSLSEQQAIAMGLGKKSAQFDTLTTEAHRAIALLRERRAALISAAVTGKIDVRGLAATTREGVAA